MMIEGMRYFPNVITPIDEDLLVATFTGLQLNAVKVGGRRANRKMKCFGWDYNSTCKTVSKAVPMPSYLIGLLRKCCSRCDRDPDDFEQAIVTWYPPGSGIGEHSDADVFGDTVLGLSLAATATMVFHRGPNKLRQILAPRSLLVMSGSSRWDWEHEIVGRSVKVARWSVTFRSVQDWATHPA